jgi:hypothetical protein
MTTQADLDGETEAGRQAYNERRRYLRDQGIAVIPDLYNDDEREDDVVLEEGARSYWDVYTGDPDPKVLAQEREWSRQDARRRAQFGDRN